MNIQDTLIQEVVSGLDDFNNLQTLLSEEKTKHDEFCNLLSRIDKLSDDSFENALSKVIFLNYKYLKSDGLWPKRVAALKEFCRELQKGDKFTPSMMSLMTNNGIKSGVYTEILHYYDPTRYVVYDSNLRNKFINLGCPIQKFDFATYGKLCFLFYKVRDQINARFNSNLSLFCITSVLSRSDRTADSNTGMNINNDRGQSIQAEKSISAFKQIFEGDSWTRAKIRERRELSKKYVGYSVNKIKSMTSDNARTKEMLRDAFSKKSLYTKDGGKIDSLDEQTVRDMGLFISAIKEGEIHNDLWSSLSHSKVGETFLTDVISLFYPNDFLYLNNKVKKDVLNINGKLTFDSYSEICTQCKQYIEIMRKNGYSDVDLITVSLFLEKLIDYRKLNAEASAVPEADYVKNIMCAEYPDIILDEEQCKAVEDNENNLLLVACAGSGKTTTIAAKAKYMIVKKNVPPNDILITSFTRKAVEDIWDVMKKLSINPTVRTFHSIAFNQLKEKNKNLEPISSNQWILKYLIKQIIGKNPQFLRNLMIFLMYYLDWTSDICSNSKFYEDAKGDDLTELMEAFVTRVISERRVIDESICGDIYMSNTEVDIANLLFTHKVEYRYDRPEVISKEIAENDVLPTFSVNNDKIFIHCYNGNIQRSKDAEKTLKCNKSDLILIDRSKILDVRYLTDWLSSKGVKTEKATTVEIFNKLMDTDRGEYFERLIDVMHRFISLFKINRCQIEDFRTFEKNAFDIRTKLFMRLTYTVYAEYQEYLKREEKVDFDDMINDACDVLSVMKKNGKKLPYKYIIIDEYQDIAAHRSDYINLMSDVSDAKIMAVGDDWQSIYSFAGSQVGYFIRFKDEHPNTEIMKITKTYRNSQELIDVAGKFIQNNDKLIKKDLKSDKHRENPINIVYHNDERTCDSEGGISLSKAINETIRYIITNNDRNHKILIIVRYRFEIKNLINSNYFEKVGKEEENSKYQNDSIRCKEFPDETIDILTAHRSKGLTYDYVIIANGSSEKLGFPSKVDSDPVIRLLLKIDIAVPFAEERRLFYVALTRTKNDVFIMAPIEHPSEFVKELTEEYSVKELNLFSEEPISNMNPDFSSIDEEREIRNRKMGYDGRNSNNGTPFCRLSDERYIVPRENCIYYYLDYYPDRIATSCNDISIAENNRNFKDIKNMKYDDSKDPLGILRIIKTSLISSGNWIVCAMPGSKSGSRGDKILTILRKSHLPINYELKDVLIRTKDIIPKHKNPGIRNISDDLNSLAVKNKVEISGKNVIVFDDITTSGNSLDAARRILTDAGADDVICIAFGRTVKSEKM